MPIIEPVILPPSEANSFLLQVTTGCSANTCTFCGAYKNKPFKIKKYQEVVADIEEEKRFNPDTRKVFLLDGNALVVQNEKLIPVLQKLNESFPRLTRISTYANGDDITWRSNSELQALSNLKLKLMYIGLESGSQTILDRCNKKSTVEQMIQAVRSADSVGIKSSVMVILGLGGKTLSPLHVKETITALNKMQPRFLSFLTLMLIPNTDLYLQAKQGHFQELPARELLQEAHDILSGLELTQTVFRSNHASNYLSLAGRLPHDKSMLLSQIQAGLQGKIHLKPEFLRGL